MNKKEFLNFLKNKKVQWAAVILVLLYFIFLSSSVRLSNWDLLTDHTTGEKIPLALDPYYFLRVSETILSEGSLPESDPFRGPLLTTEWSHEIMPNIVVMMYKTAVKFSPSLTLSEVDIFSPVLFFAIGLLLFFIMSYLISRNKWTSALATVLLSLIPIYLYRTMAGFSDHDSIGMMAFFAFMVVYAISLIRLDNDKKSKLGCFIALGIVVALATLFTIYTWGGVAVFIFMILPISFLLLWIIKLRKDDSNFKKNSLAFYLAWFISTILFGGIFGYGMKTLFNKYIVGSEGILSIFVLGFIVIDSIMMVWERKGGFVKYDKLMRPFYSLGILIVLGLVGLPLVGKNLLSLVWEVVNRLLNPLWGVGRLESTVAENAQPYLVDWISQATPIIFWMFFLGVLILGWRLAEGVKSSRGRLYFIVGYVVMVCGILFSRISESSMLNGDGVFSLSGLFYIGGLVLFAYGFFKAYKSGSMKIDSRLVLIFSWIFVMLIVGRSTTRLFFTIAPLMCFLSAYLTFDVLRFIRKKGEAEIVVKLLFVVFLALLVFSSYQSYLAIASQASATGPSSGSQWQNAMEWVRENTSEDSVFAHWWDYGYWVQTLGERATIADGGHFQGGYSGDERIGRYILTTDNSETAYSLMKAQGATHLLIDPSDIGKYAAYSRIGSDDDWDRFSIVPVGVSNDENTQETSTGMVRVYGLNGVVDEDITYENIYLPGPTYDEYGQPSYKAYVGGVLLEINTEEGTISQPNAIYIYNGVQYKIPIRWMYIEGQVQDFGSGLDSMIRIVPALKQSGSGYGVDPLGSLVYLSPRTKDTLISELYLMDDPFGEYEDMNLVHSEDNALVESLKSQGLLEEDFVYYSGLNGPIKIWEAEYSGDVVAYEEWLTKQTGFADMDGRF